MVYIINVDQTLERVKQTLERVKPCVGSVQIQIKLYKGWCTADMDSKV